MVSRRRSVLPLLLTIQVAGCASAGSGAPAGGPLELPERFTTVFRGDVEPHREVIPAPIERVAEQVPGAYELMGLPVALASNTEELMFITPALRISGTLYEGERNSDYINCGRGVNGPRADTYEVEFALYTTLKPDENGFTVVETALSGFAGDRTTRSGDVACAGTGRLERDIARVLRSRAR